MVATSSLNSNRFQFTVTGVFVVLFLQLNPYDLHDAHSTRYLLPIIQNLSLGYFSSDAVVDSLARFRSSLYPTWTAFAKLCQYDISTLFQMAAVLYYFCTISVAYVVASTKCNNDVSLLYCVLAPSLVVRVGNSLLGGDGLYAATFTHRQLGTLIACLVILLFSRRHFRSGCFVYLGLTLINPLTATHLALSLLPSLFILRYISIRKAFLYTLACLGPLTLYLIQSAPNSFTTEEAELFLAAKGNIAHISLASQSIEQYAYFFTLTAIGLILYRASSKTMPEISFFYISGAAGALFCLLLGLLYAVTHDYRIAHLQPIRGLAWAELLLWFFVFNVVLQERHFDRHLVVLLTLAATTYVAGHALSIVYLLLALVQCMLPHIPPLYSAFMKSSIYAAVIAFLLLCLFAYFSPILISYKSLHLLTPLILVVFSSLLYLLPTVPNIYCHAGLLGIVFVMVLGTSGRVHREQGEPEQYTETSILLEWIRQNTLPADTFITPYNYTVNFRFATLRQSVSQSVSSLYWVNPLLAKTLDDRNSLVGHAHRSTTSELTLLHALARSWGARFIISTSNCDTDKNIRFVSGRYCVIEMSSSR